MTDYEEEQSGEMEALESIYCGELEVISASKPRIFTLPVKTVDYDEDLGVGRYVLLKFTHTPKYPDELPLLEVEESENLTDELLEEMINFVKSQMEENLGMVMVFTAISEAIEWLGSKHEELELQKEEQKRINKEKIDEEERKKLEGTKVTIESFLKWKAENYFLQTLSLQDSDIKFLEDAGEDVKINEDLFDDLDLEDYDGEDDPDWNEDNLSD
ncbi:RWD domain-containing protein 1 [Lepeophtheirus salmonis]|uniref:RWD domain-containing protein 1 n=1 Tax=Lepeophtheirus salmonis TaxID=72036 RepID=A0A7R8CI09_LEPSM|nr:RWD domain-containing protein 1 [Lepeophtheirus salmonis]CAF2796249.1 RWD domain-containing protein 1 [Lepeophtheirus salmonis]